MGSSQRASPTSSIEDDDDTDQDTRLTPIPDVDEDEGDFSYDHQQPKRPPEKLRRIKTSSSLNLNRIIVQHRQTSETPSQDDINDSSPTVSSATAHSFTSTASPLQDLFSTTKPDWTHLPVDLRLGLDYFCENITHWHYGVHKDFSDFFQTTFLNLALRNEPLLHAIVGFSVYQRTLKDPDGKIEDFLKYYTHAVTLLLGLLKQREAKHDLGTLLTILQLATIEVCNTMRTRENFPQRQAVLRTILCSLTLASYIMVPAFLRTRRSKGRKEKRRRREETRKGKKRKKEGTKP